VFEEGQLYSPVTQGADGAVTVHLASGHPGFADDAYRRRRGEIAEHALRWRRGEPAPDVGYSAAEHEVWRTVCRELRPKHEELAIGEYLDAVDAVALPTDHVPLLDEVTARVEPLTGFRYVPAPGLVPLREFYGDLRDRIFHSTQYVRHGAEPLYTPEPDVIHEVIGHGHLLATPTFSALHHACGAAAHRLTDEENLRFLSRVFWFSVEFGVVMEEGQLRAYGAGILSSYGEIDEFRRMELRPLHVAEMGTAAYDITHYQPVLYRAESLDEVRDVIGGFFRTCTDESIEELRREHVLAHA
jgi:phenylalanine-4-hydroxylase